VVEDKDSVDLEDWAELVLVEARAEEVVDLEELELEVAEERVLAQVEYLGKVVAPVVEEAAQGVVLGVEELEELVVAEEGMGAQKEDEGKKASPFHYHYHDLYILL
jgi:hypothetical protein